MKFKGSAVLTAAVATVVAGLPSAAWAQGPFCKGERATIVGTYETETLNGTSGDDIIYSGGGEDTINGLGGDDVLCTAGSQYTVLNGNAGNDTLIGGTGVDELHGGAGRDLIDGRTRNRHSRGDWMFAGPGRDRMLGSPWTDHFDPGAGDDSMKGGRGGDWLSYSSATHKVWVDLRKGVATGEGRDVFESITNISGSPFDDLLLGNVGENSLIGNGGDDVFSGRGANDLFDIGVDWTQADPENQTAVGSDRMFGGNGRDRFSIGKGYDDTAFGEAGQDVFLVFGAGDLTVKGGPEIDLLDLSWGEPSNADWAEVDLGAGTGTTTYGTTLTLKGIEIVIATSGPDKLFGSDRADGLRGGSGDDVLRGRGGDDRLSGSYGNDLLYGGPGDDKNQGGMDEDGCVSPSRGQQGASDCEH